MSEQKDIKDLPKEEESKKDIPEKKEEEEHKISKSAQKKAEKALKKAERKAENEQKNKDTNKNQEGEEDISSGNYGELELIQSQTKTDRKWVKVSEISTELENKDILIRARVHNVRAKGNIAFIILREQLNTVQCVAAAGKDSKISKKMVKFIGNITKESVVDVLATVTKPNNEILSCTQKQELVIVQIFIVNKAAAILPFQLEDSVRPLNNQEEEEDLKNEQQNLAEVGKVEEEKEEKHQKQPKVLMKTRLDNRIIDLRSTTKQAIFRVSSMVTQLFREFLYSEKFIEIHTPKLISGTSEGGANVFRLDYFSRKACLAQSPQLYKQMCIMSDFNRVFEIGPVFRAENSFTHRHMCEFTGLDIEFAIKEHYFELLDLMENMFEFIFKGLEARCQVEFNTIQQQFPFESFKMKTPVLRLTYEEGCKILKENGVDQDPKEDLSTEVERKLGGFVKEKYDTDFYFLHRYPTSVRPFYTMPCKDNPSFTNSFDFFMRGEEITSGGQRVHDPELVTKRAKECGIDVETIQDYIDSFKYGAFPHGGCGIGLERVVMLYCNLRNIRNCSLFPRDPKRIKP